MATCVVNTFKNEINNNIMTLTLLFLLYFRPEKQKPMSSITPHKQMERMRLLMTQMLTQTMMRGNIVMMKRKMMMNMNMTMMKLRIRKCWYVHSDCSEIWKDECKYLKTNLSKAFFKDNAYNGIGLQTML